MRTGDGSGGYASLAARLLSQAPPEPGCGRAIPRSTSRTSREEIGKNVEIHLMPMRRDTLTVLLGSTSW